jgi:hypothetical protein
MPLAGLLNLLTSVPRASFPGLAEATLRSMEFGVTRAAWRASFWFLCIRLSAVAFGFPLAVTLLNACLFLRSAALRTILLLTIGAARKFLAMVFRLMFANLTLR